MSANFEVTASFEEPTQQTLTARISHFVGQNGKAYDTNPVLAAKCPKAKKKGAKSKKGKRPARAGR